MLTKILCLLGFSPILSQSIQLSLDATRHERRNLQPFHGAIDLGTTLVAIRYEGGVVVAADTRTSAGTYVSNRFARKIDRVSSLCVLLRSGSAADTQQLSSDSFQFVRSRFYQSDDSEPSVSQIARWLRHKIRKQSNRELTASLVVAGYDEPSEKGRIYSLFSSGTLREEERFAVSGSGSTYIMGYLDQEMDDMSSQSLPSLEQAKNLCQQALRQAIRRDGGSGGTVRMCVISKAGIEERNIILTKHQ